MEDARDQFIRLYSACINRCEGEAESGLDLCCNAERIPDLDLWILIGRAFRGIYAVTRDDKTSTCLFYCGQR